jgi:hypothetical protein
MLVERSLLPSIESLRTSSTFSGKGNETKIVYEWTPLEERMAKLIGVEFSKTELPRNSALKTKSTTRLRSTFIDCDRS